MKPGSIAQLQEMIKVSRYNNVAGIVSVPEQIQLPVEFRIRRWRSETEYHAGLGPYSVSRDGEALLSSALLTNVGGDILWKGLRGDSLTGRLLSHTTAKLVLSSVTGTPAATDTAVVDELARKGMDTSFPLTPGEAAGGATAGNRQFVLRSTFGSSEAIGDWRRIWVVNSQTPTEEVFDNFSSNQGTKPSGEIWELTVTLQLT